MITIRRYGNVAEAGFAKSLLIAEGVDAWIAEEVAGALGPQFVPWGMRLQVRDEDAMRALEILAIKENPAPDAALEATSLTAPALENPPIKCGACGAACVLTDDELAHPFSCPKCGEPMPHEAEIPQAPPRVIDWQAFLPRSESKWAFILTIVAFTFLAGRIVMDIMDPLFGANDYIKYIIGWGPVLGHAFSSVILTPIWETLVLVGVIEALRRTAAKPAFQIILSTTVLAIIDGHNFWPHGIVVIPFFLASGWSYLHWRRQSWKVAIGILIMIHGISNSVGSLWLICTQVERDRLSLLTTGSGEAWDMADALYVKTSALYGNNRKPLDIQHQDDAINRMQQAIALNPYDHRYPMMLGMVYQSAGRLPEAERELRKSVDMDGSDATAWMYLGNLYFDEKRYADSRDAYQNALAYSDAYSQPMLLRWLAYVRTKAAGTSR